MAMAFGGYSKGGPAWNGSGHKRAIHKTEEVIPTLLNFIKAKGIKYSIFIKTVYI